MKTLTKPTVAVVAFLFLFAGVQAIQSQEKKADDGKKAAKSEAKKDEKKEAKKEVPPIAKPRLPNFYGQVGLSDEQKDKVEGIQKKYEPQIADLRAKIKELQGKLDTEAKSVLTADQKKKLEELVALSKGNRDSSREAKGSKSAFKKEGLKLKIDGADKKVTETEKKK